MTAKMIDQYASKLGYCGIIKEKWTHDQPVKAQFDGLVSVELFNEANRGRIFVEIDSRDMITIKRRAVPEHLKNKQIYNPEYPYKQVVLARSVAKLFLAALRVARWARIIRHIIVVAMGIIFACPSLSSTRRLRILCGLLP